MRDLFDIKQPQNAVSVSVPGKLFITGEYAILYPKQPAILAAVNQYLTADLTETSDNFNTITSELSALPPLVYNKQEITMQALVKDYPQWKYVLSAVKVTEEMLTAMQIDLRHFQMHLQTELIDEKGLKLGLGSSGAVTVAAIRCLLAFYGLTPLNNETVYRLAAISLMRLKSNGSLGDIAAISHGGWVYYQSFNRAKMHALIEENIAVTKLLTKPWPDLEIKSLTPPADLQFLIGWTQEPASTENLVGQLLDRVHTNEAWFEDFLTQSMHSVRRMKQGFDEKNLELIQAEIKTYRSLLDGLNQTFDLNIYTPALEKLIKTAEQFDFYAKSSGAGGGDCGIAIGNSIQTSAQLTQAWLKENIMTLDLAVADEVN